MATNGAERKRKWMELGDIDSRDLPFWLNVIVEQLEQFVRTELRQDSPVYREILEETGELLDRYRFLNTLSDQDRIEEPMNLSVEEAEALSRFMVLESDKRDMEEIQIYLLGCRHMLNILGLLKIV